MVGMLAIKSHYVLSCINIIYKQCKQLTWMNKVDENTILELWGRLIYYLS